MIDLDKIQIENYVVVDNELKQIEPEIISLSKNLDKLKEIIKNS